MTYPSEIPVLFAVRQRFIRTKSLIVWNVSVTIEAEDHLQLTVDHFLIGKIIRNTARYLEHHSVRLRQKLQHFCESFSQFHTKFHASGYSGRYDEYGATNYTGYVHEVSRLIFS